MYFQQNLIIQSIVTLFSLIVYLIPAKFVGLPSEREPPLFGRLLSLACLGLLYNGASVVMFESCPSHGPVPFDSLGGERRAVKVPLGSPTGKVREALLPP